MHTKASIKALEITYRPRIDLFALLWKFQPEAEEIIFGALGNNIFVHEH